MTPEESEDAKIAAEAVAPAATAAAEDSNAAAKPHSVRASDAEASETHSSVAARKLVPPPKPARESRPSTQPADRLQSTALTPRTPMIVVGEPSQQFHREGAQAWTRPTSEPPRQSSTPPWGNLTPRREPTPSVGVLRSRLEAREKSNPPRDWSQSVSPIPPKVAPPPAMHGSPVGDDPAAPVPPAPEKAGPALDGLGPAPEARPANSSGASSQVLATPLPHVMEEPTIPREAKAFLANVVAPATSANDTKGAKAAEGEPDPDAPTPVPFGARVDASDNDADTLPRAAPEGMMTRWESADDSDAPTPPPAADAVRSAADFDESSILPPRPKSGPARLRSGPPRPRASSPGFAVRQASSDPPRPTQPGARGTGRLEVPPPPKVPSFSQSGGVAHVTAQVVPDEETERRSEPPVPPSAIAVMKIIAVGDPRAATTVELENDFEEPEEPAPSPPVPDAALADGGVAPMPVVPEDLEELPVEEVAPDAIDRRSPIPELPIEEAIPVVEDLEPLETESPSARELDVKPPPPPRRGPKTPSLPKPAPQAKRRQKRPWWEDVFGEDFVRANFRLSDQQVRREVDFIEESLGVAAGGVVLDLGCGPGHHAVELASRGYGVVGYDLSLYQLALAAEVAQERAQRLNFLQGDMREMAFEEMFDGIFSWNTSFGYFEEDKNLLVAERVFHALRPGGMFLIDVVNRDFAAVQSPCSLWFEGEQCVCMDDMSLDFITSRMRVKRAVILDDGRTRECVYSIRLYSMHELGKLLHDVGFRVTEASGHPSTPGVFFGEYSPRIIMLAQKP